MIDRKRFTLNTQVLTYHSVINENMNKDFQIEKELNYQLKLTYLNRRYLHLSITKGNLPYKPFSSFR